MTLTEDAASYTLSNGVVTARIAKDSGDLTSLQYNQMETLTDQSGHAGLLVPCRFRRSQNDRPDHH